MRPSVTIVALSSASSRRAVQAGHATTAVQSSPGACRTRWVHGTPRLPHSCRSATGRNLQKLLGAAEHPPLPGSERSAGGLSTQFGDNLHDGCPLADLDPFDVDDVAVTPRPQNGCGHPPMIPQGTRSSTGRHCHRPAVVWAGSRRSAPEPQEHGAGRDLRWTGCAATRGCRPCLRRCPAVGRQRALGHACGHIRPTLRRPPTTCAPCGGGRRRR